MEPNSRPVDHSLQLLKQLRFSGLPINELCVLQYMRSRHLCSQIEMAKEFGMSRVIISSLVRNLERKRLLYFHSQEQVTKFYSLTDAGRHAIIKALSLNVPS